MKNNLKTLFATTILVTTSAMGLLICDSAYAQGTYSPADTALLRGIYANTGGPLSMFGLSNPSSVFSPANPLGLGAQIGNSVTTAGASTATTVAKAIEDSNNDQKKNLNDLMFNLKQQEIDARNSANILPMEEDCAVATAAFLTPSAHDPNDPTSVEASKARLGKSDALAKINQLPIAQKGKLGYVSESGKRAYQALQSTTVVGALAGKAGELDFLAKSGTNEEIINNAYATGRLTDAQYQTWQVARQQNFSDDIADNKVSIPVSDLSLEALDTSHKIVVEDTRNDAYKQTLQNHLADNAPSIANYANVLSTHGSISTADIDNLYLTPEEILRGDHIKKLSYSQSMDVLAKYYGGEIGKFKTDVSDPQKAMLEVMSFQALVNHRANQQRELANLMTAAETAKNARQIGYSAGAIKTQ